MHLYTVIQIVLVAILFGIKLSPAGLVYPLAIVLLLPIRFAIKKLLFSSLETEMVRLGAFLVSSFCQNDNNYDCDCGDAGLTGVAMRVLCTCVRTLNPKVQPLPAYVCIIFVHFE